MEIKLENPDIRRLKDMKDVLLCPEEAKNPERELYYMYHAP